MKWFSASTRGNWIGLGFVYGTIMAFNVWKTVSEQKPAPVAVLDPA